MCLRNLMMIDDQGTDLLIGDLGSNLFSVIERQNSRLEEF